ncbi:MAG: 5-oxoprolinase subunit PxpB [Myxococcaceae bacterium]|nr:5-oxoprolinase subunit PxpB [Myxococcaceae bacterium]
MDLLPLGDSALLIRLGEGIDAATHAHVRAVLAALERAPLPGVIEVVPAFTSVAVYYDAARVHSVLPGPEATPYERLRRAVAERVAQASVAEVPAGPLIELPVCYGGEFGPDLEAVAAHAGLSPDAVVRAHAGAGYTVFMVGFAPGFPYLAGLPEHLAAPRHATPRLKVPAGSVGIAGRQTGIYPLETPGGWQLIGRTPRRLFRPDAEPPALLRLGDRVRFRPISPAELTAWEEPPWP